MIIEDYVSFEIAKLLNEKGFDDEYTNAFYDKNGNLYFIDILSDFSEHPDNDTDIAASTLYVAMKWLREVHNKHCDIGYNIDLKWWFQITDLIETLGYDYPETKYYHAENEIEFNSYEEAAEASIKYCLENLI